MRILYVGPVSWFSRKVEIALYEKGLAFTQVLVPFSQTRGYFDRPGDVVRIHPKRQVPVMIDEGVELHDSTIIIEYLDDAYPELPLLPRSPTERARCRMWDSFADEVMLEPIRRLMHRTEPHDHSGAGWQKLEAGVPDALQRIAAQFDDLDRALQHHEYLCGAFSAADISCTMAMFWSNRLAGPGFGERHGLRRWYRSMMRRPSGEKATAEIIAQDSLLSAPVIGAFADC
jgi:glutathione S-transferase